MNILKGERVKRGLTQQEVADSIGVSLTTYFRKENGIRKFNVSEIIEISRLFNLNIEEVNEIFFAKLLSKSEM